MNFSGTNKDKNKNQANFFDIIYSVEELYFFLYRWMFEDIITFKEKPDYNCTKWYATKVLKVFKMWENE